MYIREAHTSDVWQHPDNLDDKVVFASPKTFDERSQMGQLCAAKLGIKFPAVIDTFDNATERAYTGWPDRLYVNRAADANRKLIHCQKLRERPSLLRVGILRGSGLDFG